jgi:purine-binding chemotaxis protein CheW
MKTLAENLDDPTATARTGATARLTDDRGATLAPSAVASLLLLRLAGQRYALRLDAVDRVIRVVAVTPMPETPAFMLGLINLAGQLLPVFSLRRCLGLPERPIRPKDQFVIARTARLTVAVVVDEVEGLSALEASQTVALAAALPEGKCRVQGLVKLQGDIILIYDLDRLVSPADLDRMLRVRETDGEAS